MILPATVEDPILIVGSDSMTESNTRFEFPGDALRWCISQINIKFTAGSGSASATLHRATDGSDYGDFGMLTFTGLGAGGAPGFFRVEQGEEKDMLYFPKQYGYFTWTDPGTSTWEIEIQLVRADAVVA